MIKLLIVSMLVVELAVAYQGFSLSGGQVADFRCFKELGCSFYQDFFTNEYLIQNLQNAKSQQMPSNFYIEPDTKISVSELVQQVKAKVDATLFTSLYVSISLFPTRAQEPNCQYLQNLVESLAAAYPNNQIGVYGVFNPVWATTFGTYCDNKLTKFQVWYSGKDKQANFNDWMNGSASFGGWKTPTQKTLSLTNVCGHPYLLQLYTAATALE